MTAIDTSFIPYAQKMPGMTARTGILAIKLLWVCYFVFYGLHAAAAVTANALLQSAAGATLSKQVVRISCFLVVMAIAAIMITLQAHPVSYLPLVAAWLGVAARWGQGGASILIVMLGEVAWISFGVLTGATTIVIFNSLLLALIAFSPVLRKIGINVPHNLSPALL